MAEGLSARPHQAGKQRWMVDYLAGSVLTAIIFTTFILTCYGGLVRLGTQTFGHRPAVRRRAGARRVPAGRPIFRPKTARLFRKLYIGGTASYLMVCSAAEYICEQAGCSRPLLFRRGTGAGTALIFRARTVGLLVPQKGIEIGRLFQILFRQGAFGLLLPRITTGLGQLFQYVFR